MENRQQTLLKIARELNLSRTTVSVCLSGNAEKYRVKPDTVERVKKYVEKVNYIPNQIARSLKNPGAPPIGLIISQDSSSEKSLYAMRKAMQMLDESGREFIVQNFLSGYISDTVVMLKGMNVREIIMFGAHQERFNAERVPADLFMRYQSDLSRLASLLQDVRFYSVDYNFPMPENSLLDIYRLGINRDSIYIKLLTALFKAGKTPIACDENCISTEARRNLAGSGIEILPKYILKMSDTPNDNRLEVGIELAGEVIGLIRAEKIRTVVLHDDKVAAGLIYGLLENGYSVPDDIAVVGFDNIDTANFFKVPLTTIELPVMENTVMVVESILSGKELPKVIESEAKIVWRDSAKL